MTTPAEHFAHPTAEYLIENSRGIDYMGGLVEIELHVCTMCSFIGILPREDSW